MTMKFVMLPILWLVYTDFTFLQCICARAPILGGL